MLAHRAESSGDITHWLFMAVMSVEAASAGARRLLQLHHRWVMTGESPNNLGSGIEYAW
jgi:hypothetical protein